MKTSITLNENLSWQENMQIALKRLYGYCKIEETKYEEYQIPSGNVQVCSISEYRNLIKTDETFANAVNCDGEEEGVIIVKTRAANGKITSEKNVIILQ